ncbi:MAG: ABC transporter substrate-binding protein [Candidatus Baltobacteraceae bacterium]
MQKFGFLAVFTLFALWGCAARSTTGVPSRVPPQQRHVVSLMPSLTEDLFAIGAGPQVVAVDQISAQLPPARNLPIVGNFSSINTERIIELHPDIVAGIPSQDRLLQPLARAGIAHTLLRDDSFEDIFSDLERLGALTGHIQRAQVLEEQLRARTRQLTRSLHFKRVPSVFVVLDTTPIYTAGPRSYISTLIRLAGGRNAAENLASAYASYSAEALLRLQPDAIISDPSTHLGAVLANEPWRSLHAVSQHHVYIVDPAAILERPGPRYNEGLAWLIARLAPLAK